MLTGDSILIRSEDILESDLGTEKVMMSIEQGRYFGLNEVGKLIHDGCDGKTKLHEVIATITDQYEVEHQVCESKVLMFAQKLIDQGLLELPSGD